MSKVSQLAAMYGGNPSANAGKPSLAAKPTATKKWPPVNSSNSTQSVSNGTSNDWRAELDKKKKLKQQEQNASANSVETTKSQNDIPEWKRNLINHKTVSDNKNASSSAPKPVVESKPQFNSFSSSQHKDDKNTELKPRNSFLGNRNTPQQNNASWVKQKPQETASENNKPNKVDVRPIVVKENPFTSSKPKSTDSTGPSSASLSGSVTSNRSWKTDNKVGSETFGGRPTTPSKPTSHDKSPTHTHQEKAPIRSGPNKSSFLFRSSEQASERQRRSIPHSVLNRPPPAKPGKNFNFSLPGKENSGLPHSNAHQDLPLPPSTDNPKSPSGDSAIFKKRPPSFLTKQKATSQQPDLPALPNRPALPIPGGQNGPPTLPDRDAGPPALPNRDGDSPPPPAAVALRGLPPPPGGKKPSVVPSADLPPGDDVYDDTDIAPAPSLPARPSHPPLNRGVSSGEIETWDDEEDENLYDETPDEGGAGPPRPGMGRDTQPQEIEPDEGEDTYEDLDAYSKFNGPRNGAPNNKSTKEDEKKRKDNEKKDKEIRKKYKLPKEGEIAVQSQGVVKSDSRAMPLTKDLTVHAHETVHIIRMNDNPKSKWLVRNNEGTYGYVDSDNIDVDMQVLKNTMKSAGNNTLPRQPPSLPPQHPQPDEPLYDETPEDVYEEL